VGHERIPMSDDMKVLGVVEIMAIEE